MQLLPPPGPERTRQFTLLAIVAIVLAGLYWYQFGGTPAGTTGAASNPTAPVDPRKQGPLVLPTPVKLAELETVPEDPEAGRNPFGYGVKPVPPPPPAPPAPPPPPPGPPPPPPGPPPVPPIPLKLVGLTSLPGTGRTMATLKDPASNAVFQVFEGDVVDGRYRLVKVGTTTVVMSYLDGTGQRTIPNGG